jgi:peptide deformylase
MTAAHDNSGHAAAGVALPTPDLAHRPLQLRLFPDPVLRMLAQPLDRFGTAVEALARDMLALMRLRQGIGLAAPQIGLAVRLIVADVGKGTVCLVNPKLAPLAAPEVAAEGCLSLPGVSLEIERAAAVEVRGFDPSGQRRHFTARGLLARVLQHEVDHLDGILIIDRGRAVPNNQPPKVGQADEPLFRLRNPLL